MNRPRFVDGALLAAVTAGPALVATLWIEFALATPRVSDPGLSALAVILPFAALFGFVVALLPSVAGSATLVRLGVRRRWARHPLAWAAAGFAIGMVTGVIFLCLGDSDFSLPALAKAASAYEIAGAPCALLARWRTRWSD